MVTVGLQLTAWGARGLFHTPLNKTDTPHARAGKLLQLTALGDGHNVNGFGGRRTSTLGLGSKENIAYPLE